MRKSPALLALFLALGLTPAAARAQGSCFPLAAHLCLGHGRFQVDVDWNLPGGIAGKGQAVPLTDDTGSFWFFDNSNLELVVKVLDGRAVNGHFWVYYGGLSDVEYRITITDTATGVQEIYVNPAGRLASSSDTAAFDPEPPPVDPLALGPGLPERTPSRLGPEFRVNATTRGNQSAPAIAVGPDGGSMIVWLGDPGGVQGRFYDSTGHPRGGEIVLSPGAVRPQQARVAADVSGRYMVVWNDQTRVKGRIYGPDGQPATDELAIGFSPQQQGLPDVVADPAGGFLVAWPESGDHTLRLQRFGAPGNLVGNEVALTRPGYDVRLAAYPAGGGGFVLAWVESFGVLETDVLALRLDSSAQPIGTTAARANTDFVRRPGYHQAPVPVVHPDGFSVVWTTAEGTIRPSGPGIRARRFGADGQPAGLVLEVASGFGEGDWRGNAVALPSGKVMVLWYEKARAEDLDGGIFARLFDAFWQPLGSSFRINTYTQNPQILPAAAADAVGNVAAAWTSTGPPFSVPIDPNPLNTTQDGDGSGVFAQRFTTASCAGTDQLCLNGGRFHVAVQYTDPRSGETRPGQAVPLTGDSGAFWFFGPTNAELLIKVLDGRPVNGHFWVFYGALSDVEYTITVIDTVTGNRRAYHNNLHHQGSGADVDAFAAPAASR